MRGGVYLYRTRKPAARFRIPFLSYHWGYVGETTSFYHRDQQHRYGLGYATVPKPWSDLEPRCYRIPLPGWKWLLRSVETLVILATWPVYNVQKNRWNPRRITPLDAKFHRSLRDRGLYVVNVRAAHVVMMLILLGVILWAAGQI